jgi:hypothetical protein
MGSCCCCVQGNCVSYSLSWCVVCDLSSGILRRLSPPPASDAVNAMNNNDDPDAPGPARVAQSERTTPTNSMTSASTSSPQTARHETMPGRVGGSPLQSDIITGADRSDDSTDDDRGTQNFEPPLRHYSGRNGRGPATTTPMPVSPAACTNNDDDDYDDDYDCDNCDCHCDDDDDDDGWCHRRRRLQPLSLLRRRWLRRARLTTIIRCRQILYQISPAPAIVRRRLRPPSVLRLLPP